MNARVWEQLRLIIPLSIPLTTGGRLWSSGGLITGGENIEMFGH
jgi:hypothetical protein